MGLVIRRRAAPNDIHNRTAEQINILRQSRLQEAHLHTNLRTLKGVQCAGGKHLKACLRQHRQIGRLPAHQTIGLSVNPNQRGKRIGLPGPMPGVLPIKRIRSRPDAEIRVAGHQRHRRRTQRCHLLCRGGRSRQTKSQYSGCLQQPGNPEESNSFSLFSVLPNHSCLPAAAVC